MAVWSEVRFGELFAGLDLAAEHYHPAKLECLNVLGALGGPAIETVASPIRQIVMPDQNVPVFDLAAAQAHVLQPADAQAEERISSKKIAKRGDVIVSRLRSYLRQVAVIPSDIDSALVSSEFIVLRPTAGSDASYLVPYILSQLVQTILAWSQDGNEHPRFNERVLLSLPVAPKVLQSREQLNRLVKDAAGSVLRSGQCYTDAEMLLESALGLKALDLTPRLSFDRPFADVQAAARVDAEYHSPRMQNLIAALARDGLTISDVAKPAKRRFKPASGTKFEYIEIADVSGNGIAKSNPVASEEAPSRATWVVKPGDVITSTVRPIRRLSAIITEDQTDYVCSSGFAVLSPIDIESELLLAYLRLPLICELLDLQTTASMYPAISTADLLRMPFALPDGVTRQKIVSKVRESFEAWREAQLLLNNATAIVEKAVLGDG